MTRGRAMNPQTNVLKISFGNGLVRKSLARQVYEVLERSIVEGEIPPGMALGEEAVAAAFAVSRAPTREAMAELEYRGLAERLPNRDRRVTVPSEKYICDTFGAWTILESERVYGASLVAKPSLLVKLDKMLAEMSALGGNGDARRIKSVMGDFHKALQTGCENQQINRLANEFQIYIRWFRNLYFDYHADPSNLALEDHRSIVAYFKKKDRLGLWKIMQTHMAYHQDRVLNAWRDSDAAQLIESAQAKTFELRSRPV
jgi:DNA-binding GntR family transcriptional regulator